MNATLLAPPDQIIHLSGISWKTYETLLEEMSDRRLRLTYNREQNPIYLLPKLYWLRVISHLAPVHIN